MLVHTNFLAPPSQRVCPAEPQVDGGAIAAEYSVVQWTFGSHCGSMLLWAGSQVVGYLLSSAQTR